MHLDRGVCASVGDKQGPSGPLLTNHDPQQIGSRPLLPASHTCSTGEPGVTRAESE